ncbi:MAG: radical SAM protein [Planctomycetes bacterium]|nr:radical SAM protein [Planctomycetota bacterium]
MTESSAKATASTTAPVSSATSSRPGSGRRGEAIHDFTAKLRQPALWSHVVDYVKWQRALRKARASGQPDPVIQDLVPLSINLDLTTACNYACDHCIDWDILNQKVKHDDAVLRSQMRELAARGMQSVILIGGGEPTLFPTFVDFVRFLKEDLRLQVSVVSNGSRNDKILEIAPYLTKGDWVRLSLDSGSNDVFQRMHNPSKKSLTLDEICAWIPKIKRANPAFQMGFSFVITWQGAERDDTRVVENIQEIVEATKRARDAQFDYISFKPFLERAETGSEVMDPAHMEGELKKVIARIRESVDAAKALETPTFRVLESTNLRMLLEQSWADYTKQPRVCHMQALRQVVNPHGTFNCPAYRGVSYARVGGRDAYKDRSSVREAVGTTTALLDNFDASVNCKEVTCLYNQVNWWLEELCSNDVDLDAMQIVSNGRDTFL